MILTQTQALNMRPGVQVPAVVHVSQGDVKNTLEFYLYNGSEVFIADGYTVSLHGIRSDGVGFGPYPMQTYSASNKVTIAMRPEMSAVSGAALAEVTVSNGSAVVGSANFAMLVEQATFPLGVTYENDLSVYQSILNYVMEIQATFGSPLVASTVASMTDHTKIYVYIGSESGMTSGNWYYWNGTAWASGGVYNSAALETDKTLSVANMAADAKAVGNAFDLVDGIVHTASHTTTNLEQSGAYTLPATDRWFLQDYAYGYVDSVSVKFRLSGSCLIEVWEVNGTELKRIAYKTATCATNYTLHTEKIGVSSKYPMLVSIKSNSANIISYNSDSAYSTLHLEDTSSATVSMSSLLTFPSMYVVGYTTYYTSAVSDIDQIIDKIPGSTSQIETVGSNTLGVETRWFLEGIAYGTIKTIHLKFRLAGTAIIEIWEKTGKSLNRIYKESVSCGADYTYAAYDVNVSSNNPMMVSIIPGVSNSVSCNLNTSYNGRRTQDVTSTTLSLDDVRPFSGLVVVGYAEYIDNQIARNSRNSGNSGIITVSADGVADYDSIATAVQNAVDGDVILVYPGTYTEPIEAWGKEISIIGVDKKTCIITNDTGNYDTPAVEIDSGRIAGFTIISTGANPTTTPDVNEKYMMDYCIHADNYHATGRTLIIEDCILRNNHRTCFGIGLYDHNTVIIRNCDAWSAAPPNDILNPLWNKRGVLYFHNRQPSEFFSNVTGQKIRVINNTLYCDDIIALQIYDTCTGLDMETLGYTNECEAEFINNMICAKYPNGNYKTTSNGVTEPTEFAVDSIIGGTGFTEYLKLSAISYGNNISYVNT